MNSSISAWRKAGVAVAIQRRHEQEMNVRLRSLTRKKTMAGKDV